MLPMNKNGFRTKISTKNKWSSEAQSELNAYKLDAICESNLYHFAFKNISEGLALFDLNQRLVFCNDQYCAIYGISPDLGKSGISLDALITNCRSRGISVVGKDGDLNFDPQCDILRSKKVIHSLSDGRYISVRLVPVDGGGFATIHKDVTHLRAGEVKQSHISPYDSLTGLPNRSSFCTHVEHALTHKVAKQNLGLFIVDLDHFRMVNDAVGYKTADKLLCKIAKSLELLTAKNGAVSRIGGDEFGILQYNIQNETGAAIFALRIISRINRLFQVNNHNIRIRCSIGISLVEPKNLRAEDFFNQACRALFQAKVSGRAQYQFFKAETWLNASLKASA